MEDKLIWLSKRLSDLAKDIDMLSEKEKEEVIKRAERNSSLSLIELFNALNEYGEL